MLIVESRLHSDRGTARLRMQRNKTMGQAAHQTELNSIKQRRHNVDGGNKRHDTAMVHAGMTIVMIGGGLLNRLAAVIYRDLFGFATRTDGDLHEPLHAWRRKIVERGNSDVEEQGKNGKHPRDPISGRLERIAAYICHPVHKL